MEIYSEFYIVTWKLNKLYKPFKNIESKVKTTIFYHFCRKNTVPRFAIPFKTTQNLFFKSLSIFWIKTVKRFPKNVWSAIIVLAISNIKVLKNLHNFMISLKITYNYFKEAIHYRNMAPIKNQIFRYIFNEIWTIFDS